MEKWLTTYISTHLYLTPPRLRCWVLNGKHDDIFISFQKWTQDILKMSNAEDVSFTR